MAYTINMTASARRLLTAALELQERNEAVAGYLFGLATECAIKAMAQSIQSLRDDDVLYAHFPVLRTLVRERLKGRRSAPMLRMVVEHDSFMNDWDITVRYAVAKEVTTAKVAGWATHAKHVVGLIGTV